MVFIKKLEVRGFKSLGNRTITLHFDRGLTAITGPNGSGKSNLVDAMVFCLGQNSPKMLRVDRLASLIYDGGPEVQRPSSMRVTLTFDNSTRSLPIDSDLVTLTREMKHTGESIYYLNGKRIQKSALSEMLEVALMTPESLNFIPQGMVTRISELLPDEKRELIGKIVGVAQFDERKAEAYKQLQAADMKLQVAVARISEIKNRVNTLEGERNDQIRLKHLEDEIRWLKAVLASRELADVRRRMQEQRRMIKQFSESLDGLRKELEELSGKIVSLEAERGSFIETVVDGTGGRHVELQFSIARASNEAERLRSGIDESEAHINKIEESLPHLRRMHERQAIQVDEAKRKVLEVSSRISELEDARKKAESELKQITRRRDTLEKKLSKANSRIGRLQSLVQRYGERSSIVTTRLATLENKRSLIEERLKGLQEKSHSFVSTLNQLENNLRGLEKLRDIEKASLSKVDSSISGLAERRVRLEGEIAKALVILQKAGEATLKYDSQRSVAEQLLEGQIGSRKLEELSDAGALEGLVGRVDRLIKYDQRYEPAILSVGGRWINAIVVQNFKAMLETATLAKRLKIKRLILIPLEEVSDSKAVAPPRVDGVIGMLSQFVEVGRELAGMVNFVFGDTVLVDSHRAAYLVSSEGLRAVTTSGDVFEPHGAAFETGYIGRLDSIIKLIGDESSLSAVKKALESLQKIILRRKRDLSQLDKQSKSLEKERMKRTLVVERLNAEVNSVSRFIAKYSHLKNSIGRRVDSFTKILNRTMNSIERSTSTYRQLTSKIESFNKKIEELNTQPLTDEIKILDDQRILSTNLIENISSQMRDMVTDVAREKGNLEHNLRPALERLEEQIQQAEREEAEKKKFVEEARPKLQELSEQLKDLKRKEKDILESSKKSRPIIEGYEAGLKSLRRKEEELKKSMNHVEKEILMAEKTAENLAEAERRHLGEISLYGFTEPPEVFEEADFLLRQLSSEYEQLRGRVNLLADRSYKDIFEGYKNLSLRRNQLEAERNTIVKFIEGIEAEKKSVFMHAFERIDRELRSIFNKLTSGSAWLEIENPDDVFSSGVFLMTQFQGKLPRESSSVSGGEKTVSALSFILAIQSIYPSPFYLFDEIDAHLDMVNTERLSDLLRERADQCQIIVVSLKDSIVSRAGLVYGVYMVAGTSHVVRYRPGLEVAVRNV